MKLPKPYKRDNAWRIQLQIHNKRLSATRNTPEACQKWAAQKLLEKIQSPSNPCFGENATAKDTVMNLADLMQNYHQNVGSERASYSITQGYATAFCRDYPELAQTSINDITAKDLTAWRNSRSKKVQAGTVRREISFLSSVFSYAVKELFLIDRNPFEQVKKPPIPKPRNRRVSQSEIDALKKAANWQNAPPQSSQQWAVWAFLFAIETAMRKSEILGITQSHIHSGYIHLPHTKNGDSRDVPLSRRANSLLLLAQSYRYNKLVPLSDNAFGLAWRRVLTKANLNNLHFHDSRHEAISRFVAKGIPVEKLMKITGHKDAKTLINTYYNPSVNELIALVD